MLFIFCALSSVLGTTVPTKDCSFRWRWRWTRMIFSPFCAIDAFLHVELFYTRWKPQRLYLNMDQSMQLGLQHPMVFNIEALTTFETLLSFTST